MTAPPPLTSSPARHPISLVLGEDREGSLKGIPVCFSRGRREELKEVIAAAVGAKGTHIYISVCPTWNTVAASACTLGRSVRARNSCTPKTCSWGSLALLAVSGGSERRLLLFTQGQTEIGVLWSEKRLICQVFVIFYGVLLGVELWHHASKRAASSTLGSTRGRVCGCASAFPRNRGLCPAPAVSSSPFSP